MPLSIRTLAAVLGLACTAAVAEELPPTVRWTNSIPSAFVKDGRIRLYFTDDAFAFKAKWKHPRITAQEFHYASAAVQCDESPPALPGANSGWRAVRTLGMAQSERLLRTALERLAPAKPGDAIYFQHVFGEAVLFRHAGGEVKLARLEEKPPEFSINKRYGRQEITSHVAQTLEADLRAAYPEDKRFVLMWSRGQPRMSYLDFEQRQAVILLVPRAGHDPNRPALGKNVTTLASFAILDHGWSFLKNPVSSTTRTIHQALQWTGTLFEPRQRRRGSTVPPLTNAPGMDLAAWEHWLDKHTGSPRERGAIRLLINGEQFYPHFERRIMEAQNRIDVHVCIFDNDDVALRIADLLKARSTNVQVKITFDRLNSRSCAASPPATPMPEGFVPPRSIANYLRSSSQVRVRPQLNPGFTCDHSKIFLIDERLAYIGGMNFGREYRYEWHDLMAEVEGPVVASLQKEFNKKWAQTGFWGDCGLAAQAMCGKGIEAPAEPADAIDVRRLYTKTFARQIRQAELAAIRRARNHIFLENAYLYSNEMIVALVRARLRGVDVRVILPGENDFAPGHRSNLVTANYLRRHGVRVYIYPGMSHVKALLVDGWVCFGSANADALSLRLNREANLATSDPEFAGRFRREVFEADMARSRELVTDLSVDFRDHLSDVLLTPF